MDPQNGSTRRVVMMSSSPERARAALTRKQSKVVVGTVSRRRVQVVYYLTRNGQLEHPHFLELSLLPNQHLRLKDIMDRLTALRGKGMPSLYSWSSKRNYKNGYVWNDLLENDVVLPTDGGAEYVLKGSEIVESSNATSGSFRRLHLTRDNKSTLPPTRPRSEYEDEYEEEEEEKQSYETSSTTPRSRCSRGVSTEELEETQKSIAELTLGGGHESDHSPPPPSSASSNPSGGGGGGGDGEKDEDKNPVDLPVSSAILPSRNSLLLQLIACGGGSGGTMKKCTRKNVIRKEALARNVVRTRKLEEDNVNDDDEDRDMIRCMSENPRFGNFQAEEKEYFSGSIVESMSSDQSALPQPLLKRSNSYHDQQQRTLKIGSDEEVEEEKAVKGKCIPLMKSCASKYS